MNPVYCPAWSVVEPAVSVGENGIGLDGHAPPPGPAVIAKRALGNTSAMNGLDHANKGNYGPASPSQLSSAAETVANQVTGLLVH